MLFSFRFLSMAITLFWLLCFSSASAQEEVKIRGTLYDADNRQPLEFANISLLRPADSTLLRGALSELEGEFSLMVAPGDYLLRFSFVGFQTLFRSITVNPGRTLRLEPVLLSADAQVLDQVTVTSIRSMFQTDIDKRVYDVENSVIAQGGTAIDLLETLPSMQWTKRATSPCVAAATFSSSSTAGPAASPNEMESILAQFPANSVKSVEIITNPSARYDAAGIGGIINIVLKKTNARLNGQAELSAGTRNKYTGGINLNYGLSKLNFFANYNYQYRKTSSSAKASVSPRFGQVSPQLDQDFDTDNIRQMHLLRTGVDYTPNDKLSLGLTCSAMPTAATGCASTNQRHINSFGLRDSLIVRTLDEEQSAVNLRGRLQLDWDINSTGGRRSVLAPLIPQYRSA
jgi:iron complex outermembrane recepter protein